jgi:ribosome maturation factor RimP
VGRGRAHFFFFQESRKAVVTGIGQESIAEQVRRVLEPVLERDGYELVEVEWLRAGPRWTLRLFIDRQGGVGIEDCQTVSRTVEPILDVEELIEPAYDLEVSSPGLDRPLRKPADFARFTGQRVHVKAFGPLTDTAPGSAGRKSWTGTLRGFEGGAVLVDVDGVLHRIPHDRIAKANLEYDYEADLRRKE